ncbi:hypothetical protein ACTFIT_001934 [Dictyostelium discoideum]
MTFSNSLFLSSLGYNYFENTFVTLKPLLFDDKTLLFPKYLFYKSKSILKKEKNSNILIKESINNFQSNCKYEINNMFTVPKPGTNLHRPVLDLKRLNTYINNKMEGIKNLPSMVKQGYYMVKLDIKKAYLHVLVDPQYRDLFRFVWKGSHYRWKTMPFGLSTAPRIFTVLLRPVLRMLRDINVSIIAYLDDLLIVGSTKEECLSNLKKTMDLLVKLGFKLNLEKSVLEPTQSITFLGLQIDSVSMKLLVPEEKKKSVIDTESICNPRKASLIPNRFKLNTRNIPRSIDQTISRVDTNPDSTTLETGDYSTFQSHVMSFARTTNTKTAELLISSYTRFRNFCTLNSLNPANITLVVFMDYLTHLFKHKPPLAFSTINGHRSMLNQLLLLRNQTDIVNDPFITRIMTGIHKLRPSSAKYKEIWDSNQVFKHLSTIKVIPKYTYTALLNKTLVLCKMFGLARSSDLVKWSFKGLIITPDSSKGPFINTKEQRSGVVSILEFKSLDDTNSQVCPVRHLTTYLRASKGRRKPHSGDSVFIKNEDEPLQVKSLSTRSAMASLLSSNNKMGRWKSNDTVDAFYDKRQIVEAGQWLV